MSGSLLEFLVQAGEERLDKYLVSCLPEFSRSRLQGLIRDNQVLVDGQVVTKTSHILNRGQKVVVTIPEPEPVGLIPEEIPLDVIFESDDLMIINKPAGMVVHPGAGHKTGTLVHAALAHAPELEGIGGELRPGVVHRLDKDTSGLILVAKNDRSHRWLQEQFRLRRVRKVYLALVDGTPPTPTGRIEAPIGRDPAHRRKMAVTTLQKGREAVTEYQTVETYAHHTLIEAHPLTGRTHQIRLHMAFLGCPIVADSLYGRRKPSLPLERHFLHAARLTILLPGQMEEQTFTAPLPADLEKIIQQLRTHGG
ncbi:MAG TPA: RluA family pseudouridine synthase [Anaerolineaceae bacterium]|mgnify:FL=1|nr:RluA family pseudouridine synthase [Longilinea sp.]HOU44206.1 RluA family pseudouridine synthase [Anaerolineaceae bacterium]HQF45461.1 RluA family pseudouridine synthase [Anaerolineaceae bacterium]HQH35383.1 RluA family pseudouridine synthase [Anaerolineaceae bacterium]